MNIVSAGVHFSRMLRTEIAVRFFFNRKRVHIRSNQFVIAFSDRIFRHDSGEGKSVNFQLRKLFQNTQNEFLSFEFFKSEFGNLMQIFSDFGQIHILPLFGR